MNLVVKDAVRQIAGRLVSAIGGFLVIKFITPYLGPLRFGDYSTILKYFAIWSAFADFGVYVIALKELGVVKKKQESRIKNQENNAVLADHTFDTLSVTGSERTDSVSTSNALGGTETISASKPFPATTPTEPIATTSSSEPFEYSLTNTYSKFVTTRFLMIITIYTAALVIAYLIPAYSTNPYLIWGLPLGMVFSASFMASGILQIPLQLYWKMEQVSIALIIARISQLAVIAGTIYRWYTSPGFESGDGQTAFVMIIFSVVVSGLIQMIYTIIQGRRYLRFTRDLDWGFVRRIIGGNWKYGLAYYLSSFHTLLVLMVLSRLYPTTGGWTFVGVWALALSLVEILLIVPSALGNSLIHDVSGQDPTIQKSRYSALLRLVTWIGGCVMLMCALFAPHVIMFMGGAEYLTVGTTIGSDFILPFLSFVLLLSFIRQVHNYLFVTTGHQNTLFGINLVGIIIGLSIGLPLIIQYGLVGGIVTQVLLEIVFLGGSLYVAHREQISLQLPWGLIVGSMGVAGVAWWYGAPLLIPYVGQTLIWGGMVCVLGGSIVGISSPFLRRTLRQL